jgi:hypothetical protein
MKKALTYMASFLTAVLLALTLVVEVQSAFGTPFAVRTCKANLRSVPALSRFTPPIPMLRQ